MKHKIAFKIGRWSISIALAILICTIAFNVFMNYEYQWFGQRIIQPPSFGTSLNIVIFGIFATIAFTVISLISFVTGLFLKPKN